MPTNSRSLPRAARNTRRPMRPKPLIPTRMAIGCPLPCVSRSRVLRARYRPRTALQRPQSRRPMKRSGNTRWSPCGATFPRERGCVILRRPRGAVPVGRFAAMLMLAVALGLVLLVRQLSQHAAARGAFPQEDGQLEVQGLTAPVEILRDARGVPHVRAQSELDALPGPGFAHAQDRLGQMLWLKRLARGRTAEVQGAGGLAADRLARTLDLGGLADAQVAALDPGTRAVLEAYTRGVNLHVARIHAGESSPPVA